MLMPFVHLRVLAAIVGAALLALFFSQASKGAETGAVGPSPAVKPYYFHNGAAWSPLAPLPRKIPWSALSWNEFAEIDWAAAAQAMANPLLIDGRNFLEPQKLRDAGFTYEGIGRAAGAGTSPPAG